MMKWIVDIYRQLVKEWKERNEADRAYWNCEWGCPDIDGNWQSFEDWKSRRDRVKNIVESLKGK